ncbi:hypothetical protein H2203_005369 [Taxawa tesnikishii (nom. ined.)]|nr:hypothetical protein H2203_005369 [Dothideales sp. JES 119]
MASATRYPNRKDTILSRRDIEALIAEGRTVFILDGKVLKADPWRKYHPGGDKAILHMVGRDASDEVHALHSAEALSRMGAYQIGKIEGPWTNFLPPIQGGVFRKRDVSDDEQSPACATSDEQDSSSQGSSGEPSPIFEPAEYPVDSLRRRNPDQDVSRSSSATSLSSLALEEQSQESKQTDGEKRTQRDIQEDLEKYPALDSKTQAEIVHKYRLLNQRIRAEGLYDCRYSSYMIELCRYTFLFAMCLLTLRWGWYSISGLFLGAFWHQLVFTAHDAGHMGITHNFTIDTIIGVIIADYLGGLTHAFFAISHRFFDSLRSTYYDRIMTYDPFAKFMIKYQHYLYYPILTFGRFNLYRLSWEYLLLGLGPRKGPAWWHRWFELAGQVFFWTWFGYGIVYKSIPTTSGRIAFIMVSHMVTMPLHVQITLSHFAMSTADLGVGESFPQRMLRTTMDVDCPEWLDFFHGGLQFQAVHHLYPRIPRHNLRRTQRLVQEFCQDVGIPYALYGFVDGNKEVIGKLGDVAKQARILAACQKSIAESGDLGHH